MQRIFVMTSTKHSSDEIKEMDCDHCKRDDFRRIPATGFCEDCCDFVCDTCLRYHRRYEPDHIFKETNEVLLEFYSEICEKHSDEIIKFYCEICDDVACSVCKRQYHSNCSSLVHLSKYRTNLEDTKGTDLAEFIDASKAKLHIIREIVEHGLEFGNTLRDNLKTTVRKLREKAEKEFDMLDSEVAELELPDQTKLQKCLKNAIEIEIYISGVSLASEGFKKFVVLKKVKKLVENLKNETKSLEKATGILEYSYVLGGVKKQQTIKATAGENDAVKEKSCRSVTRSFKLLARKDGVHWLGLFLLTFLFELTIIACFFDDYMFRNRHIPTEIIPWALGVGFFMSCFCRLVFFMQIIDFANHKFGIHTANILFKFWSIMAHCITVLLSIVNLVFHVLPIFVAFCGCAILVRLHILTPYAGVPLKMLLSCLYGLVQKVGLVMSFLFLAVTDFIVFTLYFNLNIYMRNLDIQWWRIIFFFIFIHICNNLILISSLGIRYIEIRTRGRSDFGWFFSSKSFCTLRQCMQLCIGECMPQPN